MNSASLFDSKFSSGGTRCSSPPDAKVPKISNCERSKYNGGWPELRSALVIPKYLTAQATKCCTLACVIGTPLGIPVDPEVKRICAGSSGRFSLGGDAPLKLLKSLQQNSALKFSTQIGSGSIQPMVRRR